MCPSFGLRWRSRLTSHAILESCSIVTAMLPSETGEFSSPSENLPGDGEGLVAVSAFLRVPFAFGPAAGDAAGEDDAAGPAAAPAFAFLPPRFTAGEAAGAAAGDEDAAVSAGEA